MPRKRREPKYRHRASHISRALFEYYTFDDFQATFNTEPDEDMKRWMFFDWHREPLLWLDVADEAVEEWTRHYPGTRPRRWWLFSAPELRRITGPFTVINGAGRCQPTGIPYGSPTDPTRLPKVESEAGFLERLGLWLPGERARVSDADLEPQVFSWDLTVGRRGRPDDEDDA